MTFEKLSELIETQSIRDKADLLLAEKILEAVRDWTKPINNFAEFIFVVENEINGEITKINLESKVVEFAKNGFVNSAWKTESFTTLIEILELTHDDSLKTTFKNLQKRISS